MRRDLLAVADAWCARASGWWAATAGPTTSASAASITSSAPARTSMCWCSIPRCTRTPADRCPRPLRAAPSRSSRRVESALQERPRDGGDQLRQRLRRARGDGRQRHAHGQGVPGSRSVRRAVADHRLQPLHCSRLRHGLRHWNSRRPPCFPGIWPLIRYNPALRRKGKNPFQLDSEPPSIPLKAIRVQEARYTMLARSNPDRPRASPTGAGRRRPAVERLRKAALRWPGRAARILMPQNRRIRTLARRTVTTNDRPEHLLLGPAA